MPSTATPAPPGTHSGPRPGASLRGAPPGPRPGPAAASGALGPPPAPRGHPFRRPRERRLYRLLDAIFLWVLAREPGRAPAIYAAMMRRPAALLRFLDERPRLLDLLGLLLALPTWVFVRALWRWSWARRDAGAEVRSLLAAPPAAPEGGGADGGGRA